MREIKFNAVDEEIGDYVVFNRWFEKNENEEDSHNEVLSKFLEHYFGYKLLQYTGLKDKNGVEIYDGDIIKADGRVFSVVYDRSNFSIKASHREKIVALLSVAQHNGCEVIGNIYENKDLLNE